MVHWWSQADPVGFINLVLKPDWLVRMIILWYSSLSLFIKAVYSTASQDSRTNLYK